MFHLNEISDCNNSVLISDENGSLVATITDSPIELKNYIKVCEERRKFPVLYKLEFQVSQFYE